MEGRGKGMAGGYVAWIRIVLSDGVDGYSLKIYSESSTPHNDSTLNREDERMR